MVLSHNLLSTTLVTSCWLIFSCHASWLLEQKINQQELSTYLQQLMHLGILKSMTFRPSIYLSPVTVKCLQCIDSLKIPFSEPSIAKQVLIHNRKLLKLCLPRCWMNVYLLTTNQLKFMLFTLDSLDLICILKLGMLNLLLWLWVSCLR